MTDDLVRWLGKQLALDEAHARKDLWAAENATPGHWRARYGVNLDHSWVETESTPILRLDAARHEADALLVARFKPETIRKRAEEKLADVAAKRDLIKALTPELDAGSGLTDSDGLRRWTVAYAILRYLVLPYANRPGCRPEWAPGG